MDRNARQVRFLLIALLFLSITINFIMLDIQEKKNELIGSQEELIELLNETIEEYKFILEYNSLEVKSVQAVEPVIIEPIEFNVSAYCPCVKCTGKTDGITKSGVKAEANKTIAMDPSYPMGTKVIIEGFEDIVFEKQDIGGAIKGNKIDIYFDTHKEALEFGRQYKKVWILSSEAPELAQLNLHN